MRPDSTGETLERNPPSGRAAALPPNTHASTTLAREDCLPHEMSYLTIKRLQYGGSRAQESGDCASTCSSLRVDDLGTNRVRRAQLSCVDSGPRPEIECAPVPPGEAAHFILAAWIAAAQHSRAQAVTSHLMPTFARVHLAFERGEGVWLVATDGERYLDFTSGVAVNALGHAHPHLVAALTEQAAKLWHVSNLYRDSRSRAGRGAGCARQASPTSCSSAIPAPKPLECAIKTARKYQAVERPSGALPHHHLRGRVPRPHAGDARRRRSEEISRRLRTGGRGFRSSSVRRSRGDQAGDRRRDRGDHDRAVDGRGRRARRRAVFPPGVARAVRPARPAPRLRRGADRHGPHRRVVRLPAHRRHARHHGAGQGARRRLSGRRLPGDAPRRQRA